MQASPGDVEGVKTGVKITSHVLRIWRPLAPSGERADAIRGLLKALAG